jgi:hypothetical protein
MIDPAGDESQEMFPCFEHPTLTDLLDNQNFTWRYYATAPNSIWTAPNSIDHIRFGSDWANVILPQTRVLTNIATDQLANVSWLTPSGQASDHPWMNTGVRSILGRVHRQRGGQQSILGQLTATRAARFNLQL